MKRRWKYTAGFGSFVTTLLLFLTILFPLFTRDPVEAIYGTIGAATIDTLEWNPSLGNQYSPDGACRVNNSEYYLIVSDAVDLDGWAYTIQVWNNNGSIANAVISSYEFDASDGASSTVHHVAGTDKYAVAYNDIGGTKLTVVTLQVWDTNGTIRPSVIDTQQLTQLGYSTDEVFLLNVSQNVYCIAYMESVSLDGWMETIWVNNSGTINNSILDTEEFDTSYGRRPTMCKIDSNTIALTYVDSSATGEYTLLTYNISSSGAITDTPSDSWSYETEPYYNSFIDKIGPTTYEIIYENITYDTLAKTCSISDTGSITKAWIDTLVVVLDTGGLYLEPFVVSDPQFYPSGILGVTRTDSSGDGMMYTWNVSNTGVLGDSIINSFEFDTVDSLLYCHVMYVNKTYYLGVYTGSGSDGWSFTVSITTNYASPTFSNPQPANGSVGVHIQPRCNITINDLNGDLMTLSWWSNFSDGVTWVHYQTNSSCVNGTYRWGSPFADYSTKYWWKVYCNDSMHNVSSWYYFTTEEEPVETSLRLVQTASTGTITNTTRIRLIQTVSTGQIQNVTKVRLVQNANNGAILNQTLLRLVQNANNGAINNLTRLRLAQTASNGLIQNLSTMHLIQTASSGTVQNNTFIHLIQTASNGAVVNLSVLRLVQTASNGAILNASLLRLVQIASNGAVQNLSVVSLTLVQTASTGTVMNSTVLHLIQKADTGTINSFILLRLVQTAGSGTILNLSRILLVQTASTGTIRNISTGIGILLVYPANHSTNVLRNVTYHVTIFHTAGLPMRVTWLRDNGTVYLGSSIDVYNGTYFMFSNASLSNHVYNWSVNITDGTTWLNQSQWYRTGMSMGGAGLVVTGGNGRLNSYLLIGLFGGVMLSLVLWRRKGRKKEK